MKMYKRAISMVLLCGVLVGCATSQQAREVQKSGFLEGYYSRLQPGEKGEALLVYKNPIAEWKNYTKVIIDPVEVWIGKNSPAQAMPRNDRIRLATSLRGQIRDALLPDYQFVTKPGPEVLRISAVITEAEASDPMWDRVSSVLPGMRLFSGAKSLATGTSTFVGTASIEAKITDAHLGTVLVAAIDRRSGTKNLPGVTNQWNDVEAIYKYWGNKLRYRLCLWRGQRFCPEPKA